MKIKVEYFTDPLCAWSYASEPTVQSLISQFGDKIGFQYKSLPILDGIIGEPKQGEKIHSPDEMAEAWSEISEKTGTKIDVGLWHTNPPHSSWPANRAMKAALMQGFDKGNRFLHVLRDAIMTEQKNPSNLEVLKDIAGRSGLDVDRFYMQMTDNASALEESVAADLLEGTNRCIYSTPTLVMQNDQGDKVIVQGTLDYEVCSRAIHLLMGQKVIGAPEAEVAPSI